MRLDVATTAVAVASLAASGLQLPSLPAVAPAPRTVEELERRAVVDGALSRAWKGLDGHCSTRAEDDEIDAVAGEFGSTYGEVTFDGARCVFDALGLYEDGVAADAVFADLGSGVGRMAAQCVVECGVSRAVGVELSRSRHDRGCEALKRLAFDPDVAGSDVAAVDLRWGDILVELPLLGDVSHAYVASLLFDEAMLDKLGAALDASNIKTFAALSAVPTTRFSRDATPTRARMTWNPAMGGTDVFLYRRKQRRGPF